MTRQSRKPGGINPLTASERRAIAKDYGTQSSKLSGDSQLPFGYCCLSLSMIDPSKGEEAVCTPSGHLYRREAIVEYLLMKKQELREQCQQYRKQCEEEEAEAAQKAQKDKQSAVQQFKLQTEEVHVNKSRHSKQHTSLIGKKINTESREKGVENLKRTSYWLSDAAPTHKKQKMEGPPPERPGSPMTGAPLKLKNLVSVDLKQDITTNTVGSSSRVFLCSVSSKQLINQEVVCITKTGQVLLKSVYDDLFGKDDGDKKNKLLCPVTGKKFKKSDVIELKKASSGFAASGEVTAKKYRPTIYA